jgi:hypothetical protein
VIVDRLEQDRRRRLRIADECSEQDVGIDYDALDAAACPAARRRLCTRTTRAAHRAVAMMGRMMFDERSCGEPGSDLS